MTTSKKMLTREEELLLQDFSRKISRKAMIMFYGIALVVSIVPLWLYLRIYQLELESYWILFIIGSLVNTWLVAFGYNNVKFVLKHKIAQKREDAVAKEVLQSLSGQQQSMNKKEKDERILWKKNVVADFEATTYSIFYNNAIFYTMVILGSFYVFRSFSPTLNYLLSVVGSGAVVALLSTGSK
ncbi:SWI/SNF and RSC complex subunit Ssr3 [Dermatophagoides farinae]|uniref:Translocon-associated protein subunit gamma n=1 Tax=Dermatophagoides farinae TaxID=6954 RepID=A0A922I8U4_DERFA|nr:translocon-associated protein subunit gamma-like [Dermatophagoides farinae]KAH7640757.1 translocon-associated protein subunit gamma-like protein [Dermatophagoides farinae]KAH9526318.1 SWI/SNF and RSC complex subunit Ssr3 [Dermatophagoides farinae]